MRIILAEARYWWASFGYWLRPYDVHRDARVWRWRRSVCTPWILTDAGRFEPGRWTR